MKKKELKEFETALLEMKSNLEANIARLKEEREDISTADDIVDLEDEMALETESRNEAALLKQQQHELDEVNRALAKISAGTYGICEASGTPIPLERLRAVPHTRYGIGDEREAERGMLKA